MNAWHFMRVARFERWMHARFTPLGRMLLSALVAVGLFALNPRATLAYQLAGLLLAVLVAAMLWAPAFRPRIRAVRRLPRYATAGVPFGYTLEIENPGRRVLDGVEVIDEPRAVRAAQAMAAARRDAPRRGGRRARAGYNGFVRAMRRLEGVRPRAAQVPHTAPGGRARVSMSLTPTRRGYVQLEGVCLSRSDPLGVFRALARIALPDRVLALPQRYPVAWSGAGGAVRRARHGRSRARTTGAGIDFARLREYRPRDPLRHIHWRAWARLGEPVVKEFHEDSPSRNALVLDTFAPDGFPQAAFEEAVSVAASFVADPGWRSGRLDLLFAGEATVHLGQGSEGEGVGRMLEALAFVEPASASSFAALADAVLERTGGFGACVIVLLDLDAPRQALVRAVQSARIATLVMVVAPDAPDRVRAGVGGVLDATAVHAVVPGDAARVLATLSAGLPGAPGRAVA